MGQVLHVLVVVEGVAELCAERGNSETSLLDGRIALRARLSDAVVAEQSRPIEFIACSGSPNALEEVASVLLLGSFESRLAITDLCQYEETHRCSNQDSAPLRATKQGDSTCSKEYAGHYTCDHRPEQLCRRLAL